MSPGFVIGMVLLFAGVAVSVFSPFVPAGERITPGLGLVVNGLAGLSLMIAGAIVAVVTRLRAARAKRRAPPAN